VNFWPEFDTKCDLEKEILEEKKTKNTVSTHQTLKMYIQDFKHFICTTKDEVSNLSMLGRTIF
jgi:hypothetical protein